MDGVELSQAEIEPLVKLFRRSVIVLRPRRIMASSSGENGRTSPTPFAILDKLGQQDIRLASLESRLAQLEPRILAQGGGPSADDLAVLPPSASLGGGLSDVQDPVLRKRLMDQDRRMTEVEKRIGVLEASLSQSPSHSSRREVSEWKTIGMGFDVD
ncbi:unnamed protein product [Cyprideis torosa]|uniref:Uncharacterized protein n=1 Tax=Cyprideis torosa TaxID=163714 RepID=A0A7R8WF55_9CRUS|nr:unnamed protein product [Cyprideis torosa]CAG0896576.1 unnamed protein product [Cyprideis torosa]